MSRPLHRTLLAVLLLLLASIPASAGKGYSFDRIFFFGDSLSDSGNDFVIDGQVSVPPYIPIPDFPYAIGGKHFSNGKTWAEVFAKRLNKNRSGKPALRVPGLFTNYAIGGSRARAIATSPNLPLQVATYTEDFPEASADDLYVIFFGGNDIRDALTALQGDSSGVTSAGILADAITSIVDNIGFLASTGAVQFLVANAPNVGRAPAVTSLGPDAILAATFLSVQFNTALEAALTGLEAGLPISIRRLDIFATIEAAATNPEAFGLTNVEDSCLTFFTRVNAICKMPDEYLFWDTIHPTRKAHSILADAAMQAVN